MNKRLVLTVVSIALCALLVAGATFAYLTATTDPKTNSFTVGNNIGSNNVKLAEPNWDGLGYDNEVIKNAQDPTLGKNLADDIVPGRVIPKNPSVKNESDKSIWVAVKLGYTGDITNYAGLAAFANIVFDTTGWEANSNNTVFYFKTALNPQGTTTDLFGNVTIKNTAVYSDLKDFNITINGYAVQAEGLDFTAAKAQLDALMASQQS